MVEPRFPGRLSTVADWLVERRGYRVSLFCHQVMPREQGGWPAMLGRGLEVVQYNVGGVAREPSVSWTRGLERGLCHAYGAWEVFDTRRIRPVDLVVGRSTSLGSTLFAPVSYPGVPIINLFDYHVPPQSGDLWEQDGQTLPVEYRQYRSAANTMDLLDLENGAKPWTLTQWQRQSYPPEYQNDFFVCHDGIDLRPFEKPRNSQNQSSRHRQLLGQPLDPHTKVVSFVSTSLDRLRGFDRFHRLASRLLNARQDLLIVAVGARVVERPLDIPFHGTDYAAKLLEQQPIKNHTRYLMPGKLPPEAVAEILAVSNLHVAPGTPYVLSRSMLEAMAAGTPVLAWDTPPTREILRDGQNALLVRNNGSDDEAFEQAMHALDEPSKMANLALAARQTIHQHFDSEVNRPRLAQFFQQVAENLPTTA